MMYLIIFFVSVTEKTGETEGKRGEKGRRERTEKGRRDRMNLVSWITPQTAATTRSRADQGWKPGALSWSPMLVVGLQALGPSSVALQAHSQDAGLEAELPGLKPYLSSTASQRAV